MRDNHSPTNTEPESAHDHVDEHIVQDQWAHGKIAKSPPTTRAGAVVDPPPAAEPATFSNAAEPGVVEPAAIAGFEMTGAHLGDETAALTVAIVLPTKENMEIMLPVRPTIPLPPTAYPATLCPGTAATSRTRGGARKGAKGVPRRAARPTIGGRQESCGLRSHLRHGPARSPVFLLQ